MVTSINNFRKITAITTALALFSSNALALGEGGTFIGGAGSINTAGKTQTVSTTTKGADIKWNKLGTAHDETLNFAMPDSKSYVINRVTGGVPSSFEGAMNANGRVVVMNNAGITFARGSQTNVGALVATTARNVSLDSAGEIATFSGISNASIVNDGSIRTNTPESNVGGVAFQAATITNTGSITAINKGTVALGSADNMSFDMRGDGKINFQPGAALDQSTITNTGTITAAGGNVVISNQQAKDIATSVINLNGVVDVSCLNCASNGQNGGGVIDIASAGDLNSTGNNYANGSGNGGRIELSAARNLNVQHSGYQATGGTGNGGDIVFKTGQNISLANTNTDARSTSGRGGNVKVSSLQDLTVTDGPTGGIGGNNTVDSHWLGQTSKGDVSVTIDGLNVTVADLGGKAIEGGDGVASVSVTLMALVTSSLTVQLNSPIKMILSKPAVAILKSRLVAAALISAAWKARVMQLTPPAKSR